MARYCELCKKKMGMSDSCSLMYFVHQPYQSVIKKVVVPGSFNSFLCEDCMRMTNYLFAYKWAGKQDGVSNRAIDHSDECTNDDIIHAQDFVKIRLNTVSDQSFKSFFESALSVSQQIIQRRTELSQMQQTIIQRFNDAVEKRNKLKEIIRSEFQSSTANYLTDSITAYLTKDELVICAESYDNISKRNDSTVELFRPSFILLSPMENYEEELAETFDDESMRLLTEFVRRFTLNKINYYKVEGSEQFVSDVHGGGGCGGGVNLSGAIVGGALFGAAGAVVGGQIGTEKKIDPVTTDIIKRDGRCVRFVYDNNGTIQIHIFPADMIELFRNLIPDKEYDTVSLNSNANNAPASESTAQPQPSKVSNIADELRQLKSLFDEGILTQEEFDQKKKELLSL